MVSVLATRSVRQLDVIVFYDLLSKVPHAEKQRILQFKRWQDAQLSLFGLLLLMRGLLSYNLALNQVEYGRQAFTKPFIKNGPFFNISHSGEFVVCAISSSLSMGIDLEQIVPIEMGDFKDQWHRNEQSLFNNAKDPLNTFYRCWTRKECVVKAEGSGLSIPLSSIDTSASLVRMHSNCWFLHELFIDESYVSHIAVQHSSPKVQIEFVTLVEQ